MPTSYMEAPQEISDLARVIIRKHYHDLEEADVSIKFLFARNEEGPAITKSGWPAKALVRLNNLRDRVAGLDDVTILIDEEGWASWSKEHRVAVMDHELCHLLVCRNKVGGIKYDDANRPKVRLKPHDYELSGFHEIVSRHGPESNEAQGLEHVTKTWVQREFAFAS